MVDYAQGDLSSSNLQCEELEAGAVRYSKNSKDLAKKGLFSINQLNEKYMRKNVYVLVIVIFLYIIVGIAVYHNWVGWNQFDSFYFIIVTASTIGYGDYSPKTVHERLFTSFYIILGVVVGGGLLGTISSFVSDHTERMAKERSMKTFAELKAEEDKPIGLPRKPSTPNNSRKGAADDSQRNSFEELSGRRSKSRSRSIFDLGFAYRPKTYQELSEQSLQRYQEDLQMLRHQAVFNFVMMFLILIFGMVCMIVIEDWVATDSFYWATVTISTVGYGDIVPSTRAGKVFTVLYIILGCTFMAKVMTDLVKYPLLSRVMKNEVKVINQFSGDLSKEMLERIFHNEFYKIFSSLKRNENEFTKCEFVLMVLQLMNKVEEKDIFLVSKLFENLDKEGKGFLTPQDMDEKVSAAATQAEIEQAAEETNRESFRASLLERSSGLSGMVVKQMQMLGSRNRGMSMNNKRSSDAGARNSGGATNRDSFKTNRDSFNAPLLNKRPIMRAQSDPMTIDSGRHNSEHAQQHYQPPDLSVGSPGNISNHSAASDLGPAFHSGAESDAGPPTSRSLPVRAPIHHRKSLKKLFGSMNADSDEEKKDGESSPVAPVTDADLFGTSPGNEKGLRTSSATGKSHELATLRSSSTHSSPEAHPPSLPVQKEEQLQQQHDDRRLSDSFAANPMWMKFLQPPEDDDFQGEAWEQKIKKKDKVPFK